MMVRARPPFKCALWLGFVVTASAHAGVIDCMRDRIERWVTHVELRNKTPTEVFYFKGRGGPYFDSTLGLRHPVRGQPLSTALEETVLGQSCTLFHRLGHGDIGTAYAGVIHKKIVVIKINSNPRSAGSWNQDVYLPEFLTQNGFRASLVLDSNSSERVLVKQYIAGSDRDGLTELLNSSTISKKKYTDAILKLESLKIKLREFEKSETYRSFAIQHGFQSWQAIDFGLHDSNFLYFRGEWWLIDL